MDVGGGRDTSKPPERPGAVLPCPDAGHDGKRPSTWWGAVVKLALAFIVQQRTLALSVRLDRRGPLLCMYVWLRRWDLELGRTPYGLTDSRRAEILSKRAGMSVCSFGSLLFERHSALCSLPTRGPCAVLAIVCKRWSSSLDLSLKRRRR